MGVSLWTEPWVAPAFAIPAGLLGRESDSIVDAGSCGFSADLFHHLRRDGRRQKAPRLTHRWLLELVLG